MITLTQALQMGLKGTLGTEEQKQYLPGESSVVNGGEQ